MAASIFIDGKEGTTGLRIFERLRDRQDITVLTLPEELRKDPAARQEALHACDIAILCLPDAAARESVALLGDGKARVLDTSTAHRIDPGWVYGFPELKPGQRKAVAEGRRVAVPGCHASGFVAGITPLVAAGLVNADALLTCYSVTGYSGGGKKMIAQYEAADRNIELDSPRQYGLTQAHKHLPEMTALPGLTTPPIFAPIVSDFYSGMVVSVPLFGSMVQAAGDKVSALRACLAEHYADSPVVKVLSAEQTDALGGFIAGNTLSGLDGMELMVTGSNDRMQVIARFDNLGKGSSGAALQCLNLMLGAEETCGLALG